MGEWYAREKELADKRFEQQTKLMTNQSEHDENMLMRVTDRFVDRLGDKLDAIFSKKRSFLSEVETPTIDSAE